MPKFTLADIREAAEKKYGPFVIELEDGDVTLVNPLKMSKANRKKLTALDDGDDSDVDEKLAATIRLATTPAEAKRLLAAVGDDLPTLAQIVRDWTATAQAGEASPSAS